jgi:neopullulanase
LPWGKARFALRWFFGNAMQRVLLTIVLLRLAAAATPAVIKVEPPDWAVEPRGITLRMLLTGTGLAGATVHSVFRTGRTTASASGTHLFFDLTLPPSAHPGSYPLRVTTAEGTVEASFAIVPALSAEGRFAGFSTDDVMYLIMPDRFADGDPSNDDPEISKGLFDRSNPRFYHGGDFEGIIRHLPYLKSLGVTALWLTPIYDNHNQLSARGAGRGSTDYHGYGAVDLYGVEEHFGTLDKYRELVDKAHAEGIKMVQDQVANHTGPFHPWVENPPTPTWFHGTVQHHSTNTFRIWTIPEGHATPETRETTLDGWFAGVLPDLNQDDPETRRYLIQNTLWWIGRTGIDGIRQDTLPYAPRGFWHDWSAAIKQRYPKFRIVGEVFDSDPSLEAYFQGGRKMDGVDSGIDTLFDFPLYSVIRKVFTGGARTIELPRLLSHDYLYYDPERLITFVGNHDTARFLNEPNATMDGLERVFALLITVRGLPLIYYGDEIGMRGGNDPDNRRDFPGGWREDAHNAFEPSGRSAEENALFGWVQQLARVRAKLEPLRRGRLVDLVVDNDQYAFARVTARDSVLVVLNNAAREVTLRIPLNGSRIADGVTLEDQLGAGPRVKTQGGVAEVTVSARSAAIYH